MNRHQLVQLISLLLFLFISQRVLAQNKGQYDAIYSGTPWFDQNSNVVSAHGANMVKDGGKFYLFGEAHSDTSNAFAGFNCYSSTDLYNWKFESIALPVQSSGKLGPNRVGERVKVMKCPKTGEYVMYMHVDTLGYKDQYVGYATSKSIIGPYAFQGPLLFNGKPIKKWDMGVFQDTDGAGYVLTHGGQIHRLSEDYKSAITEVNKTMTSGFESPTMLKKDGVYFFIGSHLTSWERNDNYYFTSNSLEGPWVNRGLFAPEGKLTWNAQTTFVLPIEGIKDTTFLFMGDRWSFPKQASAATYVWQPLEVSGTSLAIPNYQAAWKINVGTGVVNSAQSNKQIVKNTDPSILYKGKWQRNEQSSETRSITDDASASITFSGKQIALHSIVGTTNGYAQVSLKNKKGTVLYTTYLDLYSKLQSTAQVFVSPLLPTDTYTLTISATGKRSNWSDKRKTNYGSTANTVSISQFTIKK